MEPPATSVSVDRLPSVVDAFKEAVAAARTTVSSMLDRPRPSRPVSGDGPVVVLAHGLGAPGWTLRRLESAFSAAGFVHHRFTYPSLLPSATVERFGSEMVEEVSGFGPVILVGHSLGGVIARWAAADVPDAVGVVSIGSPFRGSRAANAAFVGVPRQLRESRSVIAPLLDRPCPHHVAIASSADRIVPVSSALALGDSRRIISSVRHTELTAHPVACRELVRAVSAITKTVAAR